MTRESGPRGAPQAVPLTVLTGFLGAGKTTLLNRILNGAHGLRVAVLVNDFGSINIDADLVVGVQSDDVISLANGCICCSIRGDLVDAVTQVLERPEKPEYVLLEASGVAEPAGIAVTFTDAGFRRVRILRHPQLVPGFHQVRIGLGREHRDQLAIFLARGSVLPCSALLF